MDNFRMPAEPSPIPSLGSDEESFVVLGRSLSDDINRTPPGERQEQAVGYNIVMEAKNLMKRELAAVEVSQVVNSKEKPLVDVNEMSKSNCSVTEAETTQFNKLLTKTPPSRPSLSSLETKEQSLPKFPDLGTGFESTNAISISTIASDLSSEEVQNKITQIMDENVHLKATILKNNESMNSQYKRIVAWQEDVQKVHQIHKDKIFEARAVIDKGKKENEQKSAEIQALKNDLDTKEKQLADLNKKISVMTIKLDEKLAQSTSNNLKEFEIDVAQKKMKALETNMEKLTLDNTNLKQETERLNVDLEKLALYEKEILDLKEENKRLENELIQANMAVSQREAALTLENNTLRYQLVNLTQHQANLVPDEELAKLKSQLTATQMNLVQVEQTRAAAYEQISSLMRQNESLNQQIEEFRANVGRNDEIYVLQTQLEIYKADFEEERVAKENIKQEKDNLVEDLQNLQRRNQQLQEEIEILRPEFDQYLPRRRPGSTSSTATATAPPPSDSSNGSHACPICHINFPNLETRNNHALRCIESNDSFCILDW